MKIVATHEIKDFNNKNFGSDKRVTTILLKSSTGTKIL
jgi:hypothetical protein